MGSPIALEHEMRDRDADMPGRSRAEEIAEMENCML